MRDNCLQAIIMGEAGYLEEERKFLEVFWPKTVDHLLNIPSGVVLQNCVQSGAEVVFIAHIVRGLAMFMILWNHNTMPQHYIC